MGLNSYIAPDAKNKFCSLKNLGNESDVEQFFIIELLKDLGFTQDYISTKQAIPEEPIGKGRKRKNYRPDYIVYLDKAHMKPVLLIDAKSPSELAEEGLSDSQLYVSVLRRKMDAPKPDQYCIGTNGIKLITKHYDSDKIEHELMFSDFVDGNIKYESFKTNLSRQSLIAYSKKQIELFEFKKPEKQDVISLFKACHKLIWKTEKRSPSSAFYEFTKLMFIKLNEDKKLRKNEELKKKIEAGEPLPKDEIVFSVHWVEREQRTDPNPMDSILFKNLRDQLESEIAERKKKRIFDSNEKLDLEPTTIKEVVKLLEHYDMYGIDEDLNGRLFETFLTATMRGRELGQFFTPRSVVEFMTKIADLQANRNYIDRVMDACCGTAGFLIEAMTIMRDKIKTDISLDGSEKNRLIKELTNECLYGIDAGKSPPVARIARINMFLHGDGGSRIYFADSLDKDLVIEEGIDEELRRDRLELRRNLLDDNLKFDVVLTNPPFAMTYEKKKPNERRIFEKYVLAHKESKGARILRASLRSNVMFLERYWELLKPHGKFLTIVDESLLNTSASRPFRDFIKEKFIIRAVISLPKNTFVNAGSSAKSSVLYLIKKGSEEESQPHVFMATSNNVGHSDSGKDSPELNDLPAILMKFEKFMRGELNRDGQCFTVPPEKLSDRLEVKWYDPYLESIVDAIKKAPYCYIRDLKPKLKYGASIDADYIGDVPFIRIKNLRRNDIDLSDLQYVSSAVYGKSLKNLYLKDEDVLIERSGTYVGLCTCLPSGFENYVYGSYIIRLRLEDTKEIIPQYLAIFLNSELGRTQFDRLKTGALQFNINIQQIRQVIVPKPNLEVQRTIIENVQSNLSAAKQLREQYQDSLQKTDNIIAQSLEKTLNLQIPKQK